MAPLEFKATMDAKGVLHVPAIPERKEDGSLIMHAPSMGVIAKAIKEHKEKNK